MKSETFKGSVESAYGQQLPKAVEFSGSYEAFENYDEIKAANELPSNDEIVTIVNAKRKAAARAKATTEALQAAGVEKPDPNSPAIAIERMVKDAMRQNPKLSEAQARAFVQSILSA